MSRANVVWKKNRQRQTRLNFRPTSPINISTINRRKVVPTEPVYSSSPLNVIGSDSECEDFNVSSPKPEPLETKSPKSADRSEKKIKSSFPRGRSNELGIKSSSGLNRIEYRSQNFSGTYHTYKNGILGGSTNFTDSSDGSEADDDDPLENYDLARININKRDLFKASSGNGILSDPIKVLSDHSIEGNEPELTSLPSTKGKREISSSESCKSYKLKSKEIVLYSSSDDDHPIISATKSHMLTHHEISPLKRRRKIDFELNSRCNLSPKSPNHNFYDSSTNNSDKSEDIVSPIKRNRLRKSSGKEKNLEFSDVNENPSQRSALQRQTRQQRTKKHRDIKHKALELIRRRRAGEVIDKLTSSESTSSDEDSDNKFEVLSVFEDEDEIIDKVDVFSSAAVENESQANDSDFVVDDNEGTLGIPNHMTLIPLELTHAAHKPLKEHFRDAVEWLVKNKICPEFVRDDEIYLQAFRKLDDICLGLAKSKFISTQWTPSFTHAIWTRPYLISGPLMDGEGYEAKTGLPKCDACNHRKHIPISFIRFQGQAYDKLTLVNTDQESESDEEDSEIFDFSQHRNCHHKSEQWFVGSTCKKNAQYSHSLIHWKFALNEWVIDALTHEGYLSRDKVAEREKMEPNQVDNYTNKLIDSWEMRGLIKILYQDWKNQRNLAAVGLTE